MMDNYVVGSVADIISSKSSKIKEKKKVKLNDNQTQVIDRNSINNQKFFADILKFNNKKESSEFLTEKINIDTPIKIKKNLSVKSKPSLKKKKLLETCASNAVDDQKSLKPKKAKIAVPSLDHEPNDSEENDEVETVRKISERKKTFHNQATMKKDFLENTVFVGNIPIDYEKRQICKLFSKFGEIQSVRIRCVPIADINLSKKVAAIKKKFNPKRNSVVAYIKFKSQDSVNAALKANGMVIDGHHLRIDTAEESKERDINKAVFIGGLPFDTEDDELWEFFQNCGKIISVHIIRDSQTSMGKGFGYVNFDSTASVELALKLDGQEFKNRKINIKRCKKARNKNKLHSFGKKKSKEVVNQLLCKKGKKFKAEQLKKKLKKEKNSLSSDFQGKKANVKQKKKKKPSKAALHQRKLVKILNTC